MDWKNFFKPTLWKAAVFLPIFIIYNLFAGWKMCNAWPCNALQGIYNIYAGIFTPENRIFYLQVFVFYMLIPMLIVYVIICAIAYAVGIVKKKRVAGKAAAKKKKE